MQIHYLDKNKTKKFILRSSMRALEEDLAKHGLVRCHRSYFINPAYVRIVHRDSAGLIVADLNMKASRYHENIRMQLLNFYNKDYSIFLTASSNSLLEPRALFFILAL